VSTPVALSIERAGVTTHELQTKMPNVKKVASNASGQKTARTHTAHYDAASLLLLLLLLRAESAVLLCADQLMSTHRWTDGRKCYSRVPPAGSAPPS
jgi:hypothetical protein